MNKPTSEMNQSASKRQTCQQNGALYLNMCETREKCKQEEGEGMHRSAHIHTTLHNTDKVDAVPNDGAFDFRANRIV